MAGLLGITLLICFVLSVPIAISLGITSMVIMMENGVPLTALAQKMFTSIDSFPLMAIPFFILAGSLMEHGGISRRLIDLVNSFIGSFTGGLAMVMIIASMFFSAISGSGPATAAAIGSIMIPAMVARKYDIRFAASTQAAAGELGVIIPPSIPLVLFGIAGGVSIADLFIAGIVPGILIGFSLMLVAFLISWRKGYAGGETFTWRYRLVALRRAILALIMPAIILGGIYGGFFTPTESAIVASAYALIVGMFVYREIKFKELFKIFYESAIMTAIILIVISNAGLFSWILTMEGVPQALAGWITGISDSPIVFLLLVNLFLFIVGMFFDGGAAIIILAPILVPIASSLGIDPVHFGIIMVVNLAMGMITPPVGVNLFVVSQIAKVPLEKLVGYLAPYVGIVIIDILLLTYLPQISLWLVHVLR
jgi:C4-dicarboxylate transporter DctM subunit